MLSFVSKLLFVLLISCFFIKNDCYCQNLVPNESFEDTLNCFQHYGFPEAAYPWFTPTFCSPDYYSSYSSCGYPSLNNSSGFQTPHTGLAYMAGYAWLGNTREYFSVKLDSALQSGIKYRAGFYVSRADNFKYAVDKIGIYFSSDTVGFFANQCELLNFTPQVENPSGNLLFDTSNWVLIFGTFIAMGGEQFLTIGNFRDSNNTMTVITNPNGLYNGAYYYFDDVTINRCDTCSLTDISSLSRNNEIRIYPNPMQESAILKCFLPNEELRAVYVSNLSGINVEKILKHDLGLQNKIELKRNSLPAGIYFVRAETNSRTYFLKLLII